MKNNKEKLTKIKKKMKERNRSHENKMKGKEERRLKNIPFFIDIIATARAHGGSHRDLAPPVIFNPGRKNRGTSNPKLQVLNCLIPLPAGAKRYKSNPWGHSCHFNNTCGRPRPARHFWIHVRCPNIQYTVAVAERLDRWG